MDRLRLPLRFGNGHVFVELNGNWWLVDTGSPVSFGRGDGIRFGGQDYPIQSDLAGVDAEQISELVGEPCEGLVGMDVMGLCDLVFDLPGGWLEVAAEDLKIAGEEVPLEDFFGLPLVRLTVPVLGRELSPWVLDTGAQISYAKELDVADLESAGRFTDFYPGCGRFEVQTWWVTVGLGKRSFRLRMGVMPQMLHWMIAASGFDGVLDNTLFHGRRVGLFMRRKTLVLAD